MIPANCVCSGNRAQSCTSDDDCGAGQTCDVLGDADNEAALGQHLGHGLYAREVDYLVNSEWTNCAEDLLWRRSKLGLLFRPAEVDGLREYLSSRHGLGD